MSKKLDPPDIITNIECSINISETQIIYQGRKYNVETIEDHVQHEILKYFKYDHLPSNLAEVSKPFCDLARNLDESTPNCLEKSVALRKLLEAKDAAVRILV